MKSRFLILLIAIIVTTGFYSVVFANQNDYGGIAGAGATYSRAAENRD